MREETHETLEEKLLLNTEIELETEKKEFKTRREQAGLFSTTLFWWIVPLIKVKLQHGRLINLWLKIILFLLFYDS